MTNVFLRGGFQTSWIALIFFVAVSAVALGEDRFAIAMGVNDKLVIFGLKGERAAELSVPTIDQSVTVGGISFQVSVGRDARGQLTAILVPGSTPAPLHFNVLGKSVDADKAVVTLIFSPDAKSVTIHASYGGRVEVNSRRVVPTEPKP